MYGGGFNPELQGGVKSYSFHQLPYNYYFSFRTSVFFNARKTQFINYIQLKQSIENNIKNRKNKCIGYK